MMWEDQLPAAINENTPSDLVSDWVVCYAAETDDDSIISSYVDPKNIVLLISGICSPIYGESSCSNTGGGYCNKIGSSSFTRSSGRYSSMGKIVSTSQSAKGRSGRSFSNSRTLSCRTLSASNIAPHPKFERMRWSSKSLGRSYNVGR